MTTTDPSPAPRPTVVRPDVRPPEAPSLQNPLAPLIAGCAIAPLFLGWQWVTEYVPWWALWVAAAAVWAWAFASTARLDRPLASRHRDWFEAAADNTGMYGWSVFGALAGLAMVIGLLIMGRWEGLPMPAALTAGFIRLLARGPAERSSHRLAEIDVSQWDEPGDEDDPDLEPRDFSWTVRALSLTNDHQATVRISRSAYQRMRQLNPFTLGECPPGETIGRWVTEGHTVDVDRAAQALSQISEEHGYSSFAEMSSVLAFAQTTSYQSDEDTRGQPEFWQYPVETLYDRTGDCEDSTILTAALLRRLGHGVVILLMPDHAAIGVAAPPGIQGDFVTWNGTRYFYAETTAEGWRIGDMPARYTNADAEVVPIPARSAELGGGLSDGDGDHGGR